MPGTPNAALRPEPTAANAAQPELPRVLTRVLTRHPVLGLAAVIVLASAALVAAALGHQYQLAHEAGLQRVAAFAQLIEEQTTRTLQTVDQRLQLAASSLAQARASGTLDEPSARQLLREQIKALPFVRAMWVMDKQGRIVFDTDTGNIGINMADRAYFQLYQSQPATEFAITSPVISRTTGGWLISATRPLRSRDGAFAGIIVAAVIPEWFDTLWQTAGLGAGSSTALIRRDGVLMMRSPFNTELMGKAYPDLPGFKAMRDGPDTGAFEQVSPFDGSHRHYAYRRMAAEREMMLVAGVPHSLIVAPWRRQATLVVALWAAASAVTFWLSFYLDRGVARRALIERGLRNNEQRLRLALRGGDLGLWDMDARTGQLTVNERWLTMLGLDPQGVTRRLADWHALVHPDDLPVLERLVQDVIKNPHGEAFEAEVRALHRDGHWVWILDRGAVVERAADGSPLRVVGTHMDITRRTQATAALQASLRDKEALLKEVHHRVKSNLQVVTSLLRLEARRNTAPALRKVLDDMQARIGAMGLLHESLYRGGVFAALDLGAYLTKVATEAFRTLAPDNDRVALQLAINSVQVGMDQAMPCGLLVNELISNALKHAFPDGRRGELRIELHALGDGPLWRLRVSDTGVGLPADFQARRDRSLGLQLVADLSRQLRSTLETGPGPHAEFTVTFRPDGPAPLAAMA